MFPILRKASAYSFSIHAMMSKRKTPLTHGIVTGMVLSYMTTIIRIDILMPKYVTPVC